MEILQKTNQYVKNGNIVFVYTLQGTKEEIAAYAESQGNYYRTDDSGKPLYFSQRICNVGDKLTATKSGRYQVLNDLEQTVAQREAAANTAYGKLVAIQQFTGISKAMLQERLLASF